MKHTDIRIEIESLEDQLRNANDKDIGSILDRLVKLKKDQLKH